MPKRQSRKRRTRRNGRRRMRGGAVTKDITVGILSWKSYKTIENTLRSYRQNGLLDLTESFVYFQQLGDRERSLSEKYGVRVVGSDKNIGLKMAMFKMAEEIKTPYFLFCENDFELIHTKQETEQILKESIELLEKHGVDVVRLRDRKDPGEPLYTRNWTLDDKHEFKLDVLYLTDKPEDIFPGVFKKIHVGEHDWYTSSDRDTKWSNNPYLVKTEWLRNFILSKVDPTPPGLSHLDPVKDAGKINEMNYELEFALKKISRFTLAQGPGLFRHNRLDR